ncbi:glycoside hydrolase superfamily [Sporodiniella umbellata]|nr:glycoside hydrolase superfamily [Sporodiniella umbellata]
MKTIYLFTFSWWLFSWVYAQSIYGQHQLVAYIVDWDLPSTLPWDKIDHIAYAFAIPKKSGKLEGFNKTQLAQVVQEAHRHNVGVSLAIGGWTGSVHFSELVRTEEKRKEFAKRLMKAVKKYELNGLNIDWEYPNDPQGIACNGRDPQDTANFLSLIELLRQNLDEKYPDEHKLITSAVSTWTFRDHQGNSIQTLDERWSKLMDAFYVMAYDMGGAFSASATPNAPMNLDNTQNPRESGAAAIEAWLGAGVPSEKVFLGVPFYGYTHKTAAAITASTGLGVSLDRTIEQIKGDQYDGYSADPCTNATRAYSGEVQWRTVQEQLSLANWTQYWDPVSQTPFAYQEHSQHFITFDNPLSLGIKADYALKKQLGGMMVWSLEMDDHQQSLLAAMQTIRRAARPDTLPLLSSRVPQPSISLSS